MSADPGGDVRTHLNGAAIGLTEASNLFDGPEQPQGAFVPHAAVFVLPYGGPAAKADVGGTTEERYPRVQILVRSDPDDYNGGEATARSVRDALHHEDVARGIGGSYTDCAVLESCPLYLGADEQRRHKWSINTELWHRE